MDSGIIGTKEFVSGNYRRFKDLFISKRDKIPKPVAGLDGVFFVKAVDRELMYQSHLVISKAMFGEMLIVSKDFSHFVLPHNNKTCAIYQA